jgi:GntR family transcriptional regulator
VTAARRPSLPDVPLDRRSFVPLYQQLQELLSRQIRTGRWRPGDLMPSELELSRHFNLSRMVVRQALAILEDRHQITRHRGRGTFVAEPSIAHRAGGLITLLAAPRKTRLDVTVVGTAVEAADARTSRRLGIRGKALRVSTRLSLSGTPVAIGHSYFDRRRAGWLDGLRPGDDVRAGVSSAARRTGSRPEVRIDAGACGVLEAGELGVANGAPAYVVSAAELDPEGGDAAIEVFTGRYRADVVQCRLGVAARPTPALLVSFSLVGEEHMTPVAP